MKKEETQMTLTPREIQKRNKLKLTKPLVYKKVLDFEAKLAKGQSIAIIQLQYNYVCNFKCVHCSISDFQNKKGSLEHKSRQLTIADVGDIARQADEMGLAHIDITGGEPLAFKDLDELVEAIGPSRFYLQCDTNGWLMTDEKARRLKSIGIDKIQISLDSLSVEDHDAFRRKPGSFDRVIRAIDSIKRAGLSMHIATVVTHQRIQSQEFLEFLEFAKDKEVAVSMCWPKLVGEWAGRFDLLPTEQDVAYYKNLCKRYHLYDHLTPGYGLDIGCLAVKRMISITQYGDVLPCPWMYFSLGNVFEEPLREICEKGMEYFGPDERKCLMSHDRDFINSTVVRTYGEPLPVPIEAVMEKRCLKVAQTGTDD